MPLRVLERPALASALIRLGITTLGEFAALPTAAVSRPPRVLGPAAYARCRR